MLHTSHRSIRASWFLDPQILQWTASVRTYLSGYNLVSEMGTVHLAICDTWWLIVEASLPCKIATPDPRISTIRRMCGLTDDCKVWSFFCFSITKSPTTNLAFGLSYFPPSNVSISFFVTLLGDSQIPHGYRHEALTSRSAAPLFFSSSWNFLIVVSSSMTCSSICWMDEGKRGSRP